MVMVAFNRREIGQPRLAPSAAFSNSAGFAFGISAVTSRCTGRLSIESEHWKSDGVLSFAVSESKESQEAILLMPGHSWIRGGLGTFIADPDRDRPWRAKLRLLG